jgi:nucleotide-binding universal stress UspA family protein
MERIIVGVDGSEGGRAALRWAVAEADRWEASLVAVWAWEFSPLAFATEVPVQLDELGDAVDESLQQLLLEELGAERAAQVDARVVQEPPVMALVDLATPADHVVVGSRGMGGFKGLLVGSVSQQVVHHAPCPVTVVRPPDDVPR